MAKKNIEKELPIKRYGYTINQLLKHNEIFVLQEEENKYAISEFEDKQLISFWPSAEIALKNAVGSWEGYSAKSINIEEMELLLDIIEDKGWIMDFFPIQSKTGSLVMVDEFVKDLNSAYQELNKKS